MKTFLVTGGHGLLGKSMVYFLLKKNFKVVILDYKRNREKNKFDKNIKNLIIIKGNLVNKKIINQILDKYRFHGIFHLGAQTQVIKALSLPYETYRVNVLGTLNILEKLRLNFKNTPLVYSSSDKAYGELKKKNYLESDKLNAIYPYDTSKSSSDLICQSYSKTYGLKIGIIRSANIFGPYDFNLSRIVPETIVNSLKKKKLIIRSNGKMKRDYIYVDDVCRAYYLTYLKLKNSKEKLLIYNTGSNNNLTTIQIIKKIFKILKIKPNFKIQNTSKREIKNQRLNFKKIQKDLGWKPKINIDLGLKKTINWYKKNFHIL